MSATQQQAAKATVTTPSERFVRTFERDGVLQSGMEGAVNQSYEVLDRLLETID